MEGPRQPEQNEFQKVVQFLNHELRPDSSWSIAQEYPTALTASNVHNMRIISDSERILSHAVIKPLMVKTPMAAFKIAAIGSVVTSPEHRSQGYSQTILANCLQEAKAQSCDLAILWTNLYDFYRKMNFELAGYEMSFEVNKALVATDPQMRFMKSAQVSAEAIYRLYSQHTVNTYRTVSDIQEYLTIPQTEVYTLWNSSNQLMAYAIAGKGADLTDYVHEWGGTVTSLISLLSEVYRDKGRTFTIIMPHHSLNMITALTGHGLAHKEGYLGMIKIVCEDKLFHKVKKAARAVGIDNLVLEKRDEGYLFGFQDTVLLSDEKDLIRILFGPTPEISSLSPESQKLMDRLFPLPLWLWGWDSI